MQTRLAEDDLALGELGVPTIRLPLLEAAYREGEMSLGAVQELLEGVRNWVAATDGLVFAPAGAGARDTALYRTFYGRRWHARRPPLRIPGGGVPHPDHVAVRDLVVPAMLRDCGRVVLYEELPYRWTGRGDRRVAALCRRLGARAERFELPVDAGSKARAVATYSSQTPELFRPWVDDLAHVMPSRERYWLLST
jgi:hypothetical protein